MAAGSRVTVANTATSIVSATSRSGGVEGRYVIRNKGAISVDLGGSAVASGAGFELAAGESASFQLAPGDSLYGITASSTCRVDVLRMEP